MPDAKQKSMIVAGRATMYRTLLVKLKSRNRLPTKAKTRDAMLSAVHLITLVSAPTNKPIFFGTLPVGVVDAYSGVVCRDPRSRHFGSPGNHQRCNG
jgi:hypothetical protein